MIDKIRRAIKKYKNKFIVTFILWVVLSIVFVSPVSISFQESMTSGTFDFQVFFETMQIYITNPFKSIATAFQSQYIESFLGLWWKFSLIYFVVMCIGIVRAMPKHEYDDIEHGSSDWCENGEEYKVLSKNKGIILADKVYLPVDKRGNVNVLVVGRIWFW